MNDTQSQSWSQLLERRRQAAVESTRVLTDRRLDRTEPRVGHLGRLLGQPAVLQHSLRGDRRTSPRGPRTVLEVSREVRRGVDQRAARSRRAPLVG